jgi:mRNA (2'-O-methyladenosine-N6-)-methyltransferase
MQKFQVIVADPPWSFTDSLKMSDVARGASSNYKVMTLADIKNLPIKDFADPKGSVLALWVPSSMLQAGLDTMRTWGYAHKQTYVWVKTKKHDSVKRQFFKTAIQVYEDLKNKVPKSQAFKNFALNMNGALAFGMGRLFRQTHEICLIGTSSNKIYKSLANKSQRSVCLAENLRHSAKPEHLQDSLDIMFPKGKKLELFARRHRPDWVCLGNEICNGEDITVSLAKLI